MVAITITVNGLEQVFAFTERLEHPHWEKLLDAIGATIEEQTINHFDTSEGPEGPWAPVQRGGRPLILTGTLRGSITHQVNPPDEVVIGNQQYAGYGRFHQFGTSRITPRPYMGLSRSDEDELNTVITNYIDTIVNGI